jgi:hypothetical protein
MFRKVDSSINSRSLRSITVSAFICNRGLSYVVGVLLVLGVTLGAVVVFTQVLGFQAGVLTSLQALDVRRLGESLVPVEGSQQTGGRHHRLQQRPHTDMLSRGTGCRDDPTATALTSLQTPLPWMLCRRGRYGVVSLSDVGIGHAYCQLANTSS